MGVDVKIDVIYFCEESDLKMEFGLHGKYPLRLLSNKTTDEKTFINALKKAVQRSEIIITVGGFLGEKNLPMLISRAISREPKEVDYERFKIRKTGRKIYLPRGAFPIVDSFGILLGCVIESGPQSIVMLSEDDTERSRLLSTIIVPYIEEHYKTYNLQEPADSEAVEQSVEEAEPETSEQNTQVPVEDIGIVPPPVVAVDMAAKIPEAEVVSGHNVEDQTESETEPVVSDEEQEQPAQAEDIDSGRIDQPRDCYEDETEQDMVREHNDDFGYDNFIQPDDEYEQKAGMGVGAKVLIAIGLLVVYTAISVGVYYLWNFLF